MKKSRAMRNATVETQKTERAVAHQGLSMTDWLRMWKAA